jgi:hypothetical protein
VRCGRGVDLRHNITFSSGTKEVWMGEVASHIQEETMLEWRKEHLPLSIATAHNTRDIYGYLTK